MDPDEALAAARKAVRDWESAPPQSLAETEAAERATGAFSALDNWLARGGFLPAHWRPACNPAMWQAARDLLERWDAMGPAAQECTGLAPFMQRLREVIPR